MDYPQEEEFGLMNMQPYSIYKFFLFPADFDRIIEDELFTGSLPDSKKIIWKKKYREMAAKACFNTGGSRFISKNPCNITRLKLIREIYPNAKFVFIHRNPYQVVESLYRFVLEIFPGVQLQETPESFTREKVARLYDKIIRSYLEDRESISPENLVEIRMEDLLEDPMNCIRKIYDTFILSDSDQAIAQMHSYMDKNIHSRNGSYQVEPETISLVNHYVSDILSLLGYEKIEKDLA
jgi:hypothetical protein